MSAPAFPATAPPRPGCFRFSSGLPGAGKPRSDFSLANSPEIGRQQQEPGP